MLSRLSFPFLLVISLVTGSLFSSLQENLAKTKSLLSSLGSTGSENRTTTKKSIDRYSCCAENGKGNFWANISFTADLGDGNNVPSTGYVAMERMKRLIYVFGSRDIEASKAGFLLQECSKYDYSCSKKAMLYIWNSTECKKLKIPKVCLHGARMCVGKSTVWPNYFSTSRIDSNLQLSSYRLNFKNETFSSLYVNDETCSPVHLVTVFGKKISRSGSNSNLIDGVMDMFRTIMHSDDTVGSSLKNFRQTMGNIMVEDDNAPLLSNNNDFKPEDYTWGNILFHNSSATKPSSEYFNLPSWCSTTV